MTTTTAQAESPRTVGEALQYCADALAGSEAYFGHGTDNPWDEAVNSFLQAAT